MMSKHYDTRKVKICLIEMVILVITYDFRFVEKRGEIVGLDNRRNALLTTNTEVVVIIVGYQRNLVEAHVYCLEAHTQTIEKPTVYNRKPMLDNGKPMFYNRSPR